MQLVEAAPLTKPVDVGAEAPRPLGPLARVLFVIALYAVPVVAAVRPVTDNDIWWHLRTGQWIVEHEAVPTTDPFALPTLGEPWAAYSWLFELLVYGLYQRFGLAGIIFYRLALALLIAHAFHRLVARREPRFLPATVLTGAAFVVLLGLLNERSWLFTVLIGTWTLDAMLALREGRAGKAVWLLPFAYVVWANTHIQFVYGLFLLGLGCVAPLLDRALKVGAPGGARTAGSAAWWQLVGLTMACSLAILVNPYHVRLLGVIVEYAVQPGPYRWVIELTGPDFRMPWDWAMLGLAAAAVFALARRSALSSFEVLLLLAAAYFAFKMRRDSWFLALAAVAILASRSRRAGSHEESVPWRAWQTAAVLAGLVLMTLLTWWGRGLTQERLEAEVRQRYPVDAAAFVERQGLAGPLYNHFNWGGYLIWRLPELPVAIDGRTNLHGDARIARFEETWAGVPNWSSDPDLAAARVVLVNAGMPLASLLRLDPRFEPVYEDAVAVVYVPRRSVR
jgi:hypothetical protein